jgi:hypothetical protein
MHAMTKKAENKIIPASAETGGEFKIGETLSIYEAVMVYAGRHPGGAFMNGKVTDYVRDESDEIELDAEGRRKTEPAFYGRADLETHEVFLGRRAMEGPRKLSWGRLVRSASPRLDVTPNMTGT